MAKSTRDIDQKINGSHQDTKAEKIDTLVKYLDEKRKALVSDAASTSTLHTAPLSTENEFYDESDFFTTALVELRTAIQEFKTKQLPGIDLYDPSPSPDIKKKLNMLEALMTVYNDLRDTRPSLQHVRVGLIRETTKLARDLAINSLTDEKINLFALFVSTYRTSAKSFILFNHREALTQTIDQTYNEAVNNLRLTIANCRVEPELEDNLYAVNMDQALHDELIKLIAKMKIVHLMPEESDTKNSLLRPIINMSGKIAAITLTAEQKKKFMDDLQEISYNELSPPAQQMVMRK